jgi:uncharacterized protein (UPF0335 family)
MKPVQNERRKLLSGSNVLGAVAGFVDRIERLEEEKRALAADIKDVYGEAKAAALDAGVLRALVAKRRKDPEKLSELQTALALYETAYNNHKGTTNGKAQ